MTKENNNVRRPANPDIEEKAYSRRINTEKLEKLGRGIHNHVVIARRYRDQNYSTKMLAEELQTNTRYISAAVVYRYGCNYSVLVNRLRIEDAKQMLENPDCSLNLDDIAFAVGFSNRQSFYTAFSKECGVTPRVYRARFQEGMKKLKSTESTSNDDSFIISFD